MLYRQFIKFLLVGGSATAVQFLVLIVLVEYTRLQPVASAILAYMTAAGVNYLGNYYFTFNTQNHHWQSVVRFVLVVLMGLAVNTLVFWAGLRLLPHYLWAQIVATGVTLWVNFILHRHFTFR